MVHLTGGYGIPDFNSLAMTSERQVIAIGGPGDCTHRVVSMKSEYWILFGEAPDLNGTVGRISVGCSDKIIFRPAYVVDPLVRGRVVFDNCLLLAIQDDHPMFSCRGHNFAAIGRTRQVVNPIIWVLIKK